jgi:hypothetical protein
MTVLARRAKLRKYPVNPLTAKERCDRCGAQAYSKVVMPNGSSLLFCAHHLHENLPKLMDTAAAIDDYTDAIDD